ncbi:hypothetical protein AVV12_gp34 [Streptomyces phage SF3]|uniref:Uncharacterized protein n=1 Tax=Streptomyces phage SF3 TaxID=1690818 RepID=A0A0M3UKC3_9CAUD|nr:hypothetical protein AVV12_gp34 [Streptomyces phage SF3]ALF00165.1 hypothetical protein SF3_340 [Streptomyces phage SF3]
MDADQPADRGLMLRHTPGAT